MSQADRGAGIARHVGPLPEAQVAEGAQRDDASLAFDELFEAAERLLQREKVDLGRMCGGLDTSRVTRCQSAPGLSAGRDGGR